ncbi:hypothetical protein KV557_00420 [Kitasatospora aureofaciens]|uniref:hypothetical protein n=1 Tax=Kitasatospora aureofaciens TaxID=1894 RepID=UPI001C4494BA|nr:hypothetical protein [Kitasatospora aureofaciens]MBV6695589.1 hypothetical protein [Kitasatospora aureofaciens]
MATHDGRIRTHKPEMARDPKLAEVSLTAERTFIYLLNFVDDKGRHIDDAGIVRGLIWKRKKSWDGGVHTSERVEGDLRQLTEVGLVCRYVNPADEGEELLHVVNFNKHQRIDKPSQSRLAPCPLHQTQEAAVDNSVPAKRTRKKTAESHPEPHPATITATAETTGQGMSDTTDLDHQDPCTGDSTTPSTTPSENGSRITDPGSTPPGGGCAAPAQSLSPEEPSAEQVAAMHPHATGAKALVAEYVRTCPQQPTERFRGHLGREIKQLLAAGYSVEQVRAGLRLLAKNPKGPSALESFVQEALTSRQARSGAPYQAWTNPATGAAAYAGDL